MGVAALKLSHAGTGHQLIFFESRATAHLLTAISPHQPMLVINLDLDESLLALLR